MKLVDRKQVMTKVIELISDESILAQLEDAILDIPVINIDCPAQGVVIHYESGMLGMSQATLDDQIEFAVAEALKHRR